VGLTFSAEETLFTSGSGPAAAAVTQFIISVVAAAETSSKKVSVRNQLGATLQ